MRIRSFDLLRTSATNVSRLSAVITSNRLSNFSRRVITVIIVPIIRIVILAITILYGFIYLLLQVR